MILALLTLSSTPVVLRLLTATYCKNVNSNKTTRKLESFILI